MYGRYLEATNTQVAIKNLSSLRNLLESVFKRASHASFQENAIP